MGVIWDLLLMYMTPLASHFICHYTPYACKLLLIASNWLLCKSHFKKACRFIGFSSLGCPRKIIPTSVKTLQNYLLDWCSSKYFTLWKLVIKITSLLTEMQVTLTLKAVAILRHYTTVRNIIIIWKGRRILVLKLVQG